MIVLDVYCVDPIEVERGDRYVHKSENLVAYNDA